MKKYMIAEIEVLNIDLTDILVDSWEPDDEETEIIGDEG